MGYIELYGVTRLKVIILGIDGLEYNLVRRWNLKGYMQKYYGCHYVKTAVKPGEPIYTPLIWASFLIGEPSYKYGLSMQEIIKQRARVGYGIIYPLYVIKSKIFKNRNLGIRDLLAKMRLFRRDKVVKAFSEIEKLPDNAIERTFVKVAERLGFKVWVKEFPTLIEPRYAEVRAEFSKYINHRLSDRIAKLEELFEYSITSLEKAVNALRDNDLVLYYTALIDEANHFLFRPKCLKCMVALATYYKKLEKAIDYLLDDYKKNCAILIVSDHGYDPKIHDHSEYGFWSSNVKLPRNPVTILDFKTIILEMLKR